MRAVRQQFRHQPDRGIHGDCHRAALASLFEMDLWEVPHFADGSPAVGRFHARVSTWLRERNLSSVTFPLQGRLSQVLDGVSNSCPDAYWLLAGTSRQGGDHLVICFGNEIVHDPGYGVRGLAGPCADGYYWATFLTPIDPSQLPRQIGWRKPTQQAPWWRRILSGILP